MNVRQLVNKVLVGLRKDQIEDSTTELTDKFHLLVLQKINDAKEDIEAVWDWHAIRSAKTVSVTAGEDTYTISGTNVRSRLQYRHDEEGRFAQVFDITPGSRNRMTERTREEIVSFRQLDDTGLTQAVCNDFYVTNDGSTMILELWPMPSESRTVTVRCVVPQEELEADSLDTELLIPPLPVWRQALCDVIQERGEELQGEGSLTKLQTRADSARIDAIWNERTDDDNTAFVR